MDYLFPVRTVINLSFPLYKQGLDIFCKERNIENTFTSIVLEDVGHYKEYDHLRFERQVHTFDAIEVASVDVPFCYFTNDDAKMRGYFLEYLNNQQNARFQVQIKEMF